ncbi:hypothetical protein PSE_2571 [Pseudovibrio sp. FO-BEG1]|nr:hypothetical protein PSE_2571 [Pseudovibrio sp. FO-BEG1]
MLKASDILEFPLPTSMQITRLTCEAGERWVQSFIPSQTTKKRS